MSMPIFPPQPNRPNLHQTVIDLLDSIALEEIALSHLLNAEAEKIQQFVRNASACTPANVLIDFNTVVNETLETVIMQEWLLLRKVEKVTRFFHRQFPPPPPAPVPPCPQEPPRPPVHPTPPKPPLPPVQSYPTINTCRARPVCRVSCKPKSLVKKRRSYCEE